MFRECVKLAPPSTVGAMGDVTYGADVDHEAFVDGERRLVRDFEGREVNCSGTAFVRGEVAGLDHTGRASRLTLPARLGSRVVVVIGWVPRSRPNGDVHHTELHYL